ncbi:MAG: helix-turn-helix transcriptional regulator [Solobacterium sp.]|nr:helix-turn-helix transcriptional regulator [Solobacterium sp.]
MKLTKRKNLISFEPERIKYACKVAGITQKKLAEFYAGLEHVCISPASAAVELSRAKQYRYISPALLDDIGKLLDTSPRYIKGDYNFNYSELVKKYGERFDNRRVDPEGFFIPHYAYDIKRTYQVDFWDHIDNLVQLAHDNRYPDDKKRVTYTDEEYIFLTKSIQGIINAFLEKYNNTKQ